MLHIGCEVWQGDPIFWVVLSIRGENVGGLVPPTPYLGENVEQL